MDTDNAPGKQIKRFRNISPEDQRIVNRLVEDRVNKSKPDISHLDLAPLQRVFQKTFQNASDIPNIFQVLPELHLPREILVSAIVSPGDLTTRSIRYSNEMDVDSSLNAQLVQEIEEFYTNDKNLHNKVYNWVDDALIWQGAHPIVIVPEAAIDKIILGGSYDSASLESASKFCGEWQGDWYAPKGIFGIRLERGEAAGDGNNYVSLESARPVLSRGSVADHHTIKMSAKNKRGDNIKLPFRVTDNLAVLRAPAVNALKQCRGLESAYGVPSLENRRRQRQAQAGKKPDLSAAAVHNRFFRSAAKATSTLVDVMPTLKQSGEENYGYALEYHPSIEAMMPIITPGSENEHAGYLMFLDKHGYPVSYSRKTNYYDQIRRGFGGLDDGSDNGAAAGELLNMANEQMSGRNFSSISESTIDRLADIHAQVLEADITARLKEGLRGGDFELAHREHINRMLLARTARNEMTTVLYVPADMCIYIAYDYNEYGIGKSILEDAKALCAMKAVVTVANVMGATQNAIPGKHITLKLDPDDQDPVHSATYMAQEAVGLTYQQFPMNINSAMGLAEQLQLSSISLSVEGNPRFPDIETNVTAKESTFSPIDGDLEKRLDDRLTRVFSLTPDMVDNINQPEFATVAVRNSLLLLKRVLGVQAATNPFITDYVRIYTYNSGALVDRLLKIIDANMDALEDKQKEDPEGFLQEWIEQIVAELPKPDTDNLKAQKDSFQNYSDFIDLVLPAFLREEYFDGMQMQDIKDALTTLVAQTKGKLLRDFLRERGIMRELDIFSNGEDGSPLYNMQEDIADYTKSIVKAVGSYATTAAKDSLSRKAENKKLAEIVDKAKKAIESMMVNEDEFANAGMTEPQPGDADANSGMNLDDDSLGLDDDLPLDDDQVPPAEETVVEADAKPDDEEEADADPDTANQTPESTDGTGDEGGDDLDLPKI